MRVKATGNRYRVQAPSLPGEKWKVVDTRDPKIVAVFDTEEAAERDRDRRNRLSTKTTHKAQAV